MSKINVLIEKTLEAALDNADIEGIMLRLIENRLGLSKTLDINADHDQPSLFSPDLAKGYLTEDEKGNSQPKGIQHRRKGWKLQKKRKHPTVKEVRDIKRLLIDYPELADSEFCEYTGFSHSFINRLRHGKRYSQIEPQEGSNDYILGFLDAKTKKA